MMRPCESVIGDFEELAVGLKALAAFAGFFQEVSSKGYPLVFAAHPKDPDVDMFIDRMYHPLLVTRNMEVVPNLVQVHLERRAILVTGSNRNGKTLYKDAIALHQVIYQAGGPAIANEAYMKPRKKLLTHVFHRGDLFAGESDFSNDSKLAKKFIDDLTTDSMGLIDEVFRGTAPLEGAQLCARIQQKVVETYALTFNITHYLDEAEKFSEHPRVDFVCFNLDHSQSPPAYTYRGTPGISKESDALFVAEQYGLGEDNLTAIIRQKRKAGEIWDPTELLQEKER